ncbi:hypothetical protein H4R23_004401 [Coemansia sp. Cherry 401B]|nr:hypothetical protein H4R23_004401 [Coemansia sp. Cherry 401B]
MALRLPDECLLRVLDFLWNDESRTVHRFFERRSQHAREYDQQQLHTILNARSIAPVHVCRPWRQRTVRRYFRFVVIDLRKRTPRLPECASLFAFQVFVLAGSGCQPMPLLPHARVLGLCVFDAEEQQQQQCRLTCTLRTAMPRLCAVWLQCVGRCSALAVGLTLALTAGNSHAGAAPRVTAIHLDSTDSQSRAADVIRACSRDLQFLSLGKVSGGALGSIIYQDSVQVEYLQLKRLLFTVTANTHIYAHLPGYTRNPFPQLEELYFDDGQAHGLPREEWFAPLFDVFLSHRHEQLRYLTFPIVYNTQRRVSRENCPELVGLRHIKCCWATGTWSMRQPESDSTRVLSAIASIPTLECYVHPSYIARLSSVPSEIMCGGGLRRLDLYGWPLTLDNMVWIIREFRRLQTLRVTLTRAGGNDDGWRPRNCVLSSLAVGSTDIELDDLELDRLLGIVETLPLRSLSLYSAAYALATSAMALQNSSNGLQVVNLDNCGLGSGYSPLRSPLARLTTAASASVSSSTSWNLIHPLLIDG